MNRAGLLRQLSRPPAADLHELLPTGSVSLDALLGGGWPAGVISEISGPPGYAEPLVYRAIAAVQLQHPANPAVLCCRSYSIRLTREFRIDPSRLIVTGSPEKAVSAARQHDLCIAVFDQPLDPDIPARGGKRLSVLCMTVQPGDVRSSACIQLTRYGGAPGWAWAQCMWHPGPPSWLASVPVCLGASAFSQEILDAAVLLDIVTVRGRWYRYGQQQIGHSWKSAVRELDNVPDLRLAITADIAGHMPVHAGWRHIYGPA